MSTPQSVDLETGTFDTWVLVDQSDAAKAVVVVKVDDKAAVRQKIVTGLRRKHLEVVLRSEWHAKEARASGLSQDWDYIGIALHHAGNSYTCNADGAHEMRRVQEEHFERGSSDIGYHYGIDCLGRIYEGRDIRFQGAHIGRVPGVVGIVLLADLSVRGEQRKSEGDLPWWKKSGFGLLPTYDDIAIRHDEATESQINSLEELTETLKSNFDSIVRFGGHRDWARHGDASRACPGAYGLILADMMRRKFALEKP